MKNAWIVVVWLCATGCDRADDLSRDYLTALGHKNVSCTGEAQGAAICSTDGRRYRCVAATSGGCGPSAVACELLREEVEAP